MKFIFYFKQNEHSSKYECHANIILGGIFFYFGKSWISKGWLAKVNKPSCCLNELTHFKWYFIVEVQIWLSIFLTSLSFIAVHVSEKILTKIEIIIAQRNKNGFNTNIFWFFFIPGDLHILFVWIMGFIH